MPLERAKRRQVARRASERLRPTDTLCDLGDDALLVIAADTGERAVLALGEELERRLANGGPAIHVRTKTADERSTATELLVAASGQAEDRDPRS